MKIVSSHRKLPRASDLGHQEPRGPSWCNFLLLLNTCKFCSVWIQTERSPAAQALGGNLILELPVADGLLLSKAFKKAPWKTHNLP